MECVMGIRGKDFVLLATDTSAARSIVAMKTDHEKSIALSRNLVMSCIGDSGDVMNFSEYIHKNISLYRIRNGYELSPRAASNFTRRNLAEALRSRDAYQVNMLLGGCDKDEGGVLFFMDYLSALVEVPFAAHGYGSFFTLSIMDRFYDPDMSKEEAIVLLQKCIDEIAQRFIVNMPVFKLKLVQAEGISELPNIIASPRLV